MSLLAVDGMIGALQKLSDPKFAAEVAKEAAPGVLAALQESASAGTDTKGKAWASKKDGSRALKDAANAISIKVVGTVIQITLAYPYSIWNNMPGGETRPRRRILPEDGEIPPKVREAIMEAAKRVFARTVA